tara:strand:+ start:3173 stop:4453 length:1281 start_codon:yes stop_codon:yes gene_type:complete
MESLRKIREYNLKSHPSKFVGGTNKRVYKNIHCGENHSLIREGDEIKIVSGKEDVSYEIDNIPFMLQFTCSDKKNECYRHEQTDSVVCVTKDKMSIPETKKLYKMSNDKVVDFEETKNMYVCTHQKMQDFENGSATVFHKNPEKCKKIFDESMKTCKNSDSQKCHEQVKLATELTDTCKLSKDSFDTRMAAYPYTSNPDFDELNRITPKKDFEIMLKDKSSWAESVRKDEKVIAPLQCDTLGAPCGLNHNMYHGQCAVISKNSRPVCKPILDEFDLKDAQNWIDSHPDIKARMKQEGLCKKEFKNFSICKEFNDHGKCIHTIQEYSEYGSGPVCDNPYYKKDDVFVCQKNKHTFSGENEYDTHVFDTKMGLNDLKTKCLNMDKGFGVTFYDQENGDSVCNVLKQKPDGVATTSSAAVSGSVCTPLD